MEHIPSTNSNSYRVRFFIDEFSLSSDAPSSKSPLHFGRECSIRLNINPPPGKRVKRLVATTQLRVSKSAEVDLLVNGQLKLGTTSLGYVRDIGKQGEKVTEKVIPIHIDTQKARQGGDPMPVLSCSEPKIIGFDYTFIAKLGSDKEKVSATLAGEKTSSSSPSLRIVTNVVTPKNIVGQVNVVVTGQVSWRA